MEAKKTAEINEVLAAVFDVENVIGVFWDGMIIC